jgi:Fe-S-cluster containining protein
MKKLQVVEFDYFQHCQPCLECCKNENLYLSEKEKDVYGERSESTNCHHLKGDGKCDIHNERPMECRIYPFDLKKIDGKIKWLVWESCPATTAMKHDFYMQEIQKYEQTITDEWALAYVSHHEQNEPKKYSGMNFKILKIMKGLE